MNKKSETARGEVAGMGTQVVWAGEQDGHPYNATQTPIVVSAAYGYQDVDHWYEVALGQREGYIYSRMSNPTVATLEAKLCELEGAESAVAFSSGMAAISAVLHTFLCQGKRVVSTRDSYGGTNKIFEEFLPRMGVDVATCLDLFVTPDMGRPEAEQAVRTTIERTRLSAQTLAAHRQAVLGRDAAGHAGRVITFVIFSTSDSSVAALAPPPGRAIDTTDGRAR